jgi:hypothetical protein
MEMKFVTVESELGEQLFTFPKNINHSDFAEVLSNIRHESPRGGWERMHKKPISSATARAKH